jgi:catechol 2,3-dioxygenase-like lactoylglutathione lyase family enzyme
MLGINHTGITVTDLDKSIKFYTEVLGMELLGPPTDWDRRPEVAKGVGVPGAVARFAMLRLGNGEIELVQYQTPKSPVDKPMPQNTIGPQHLCFLVKDVDAEMKELEAKGVKFFGLPIMDLEGPTKGSRGVFFYDPDGIALEIIEAIYTITPRG